MSVGTHFSYVSASDSYSVTLHVGLYVGIGIRILQFACLSLLNIYLVRVCIYIQVTFSHAHTACYTLFMVVDSFSRMH